jgi:LysR family transcriptional regulator, transcriptional activator of nhaA
MSQLNHQHLYYFWSAVKEGSITKASQKLFLSQSTISDQIIKLEKFLGHTLLVRQKKGLILTEEGKVVVGYANDIFNSTHELINTFRGGRLTKSYRISIGIDDNVSRQAAFKLLTAVFEHPLHPTVDSYEGNYDEHITYLRMHSLDLILSDQNIHEKSGEYLQSEVGQFEMVFMASPMLARKIKSFPADLTKIPLILPALSSPLTSSFERFFIQSKIKPNVVGRIQDVELMKLLVVRGLAAGPFHVIAVGQELKDKRLVKLGTGPIGIKKTLWLIAKKRLRMNPIAVDLLKNWELK